MLIMKAVKFLLGAGLVVAGWYGFNHRDFVIDAFDWQQEEGIELTARSTTTVIFPSGPARTLPEPPEPRIPIAEPADTRNVSLPRVRGRNGSGSSAIDFSGGTSTLFGTVFGPTGALAGATVRLDKVEDDASSYIDMTSGEDGGFAINGLPGGRYRVRAWREPDLTMLESQTAFLGDGEEATFSLAVAPHGQLELEGFTDSRQFIRGNQPRFGVTVRTGTVGSDGRLYLQGAPGQLVSVTAGGSLASQRVTGVTDSRGIATFTLNCTRTGGATITFSVSDRVVEHPTPDCSSPAPPPTAAPSTPQRPAGLVNRSTARATNPGPAATATPAPVKTTATTSAPTTTAPPTSSSASSTSAEPSTNRRSPSDGNGG